MPLDRQVVPKYKGRQEINRMIKIKSKEEWGEIRAQLKAVENTGTLRISKRE